MRLSELLGTEVRDGNGRILGVVRDIRAVVDEDDDRRWRDGRVEALIVAPPRRPRPRADRPLVFRGMDRWFDAAAREVPWNAVTSVEPTVINVRISR